MRIAIDARAYFQRTGIARYTRGLVHALAAISERHDVLVLLSDHHRPDELSLPPHVRVQVSTAPWLGGEVERVALEREVAAWKADLFHAIFPPVALEGTPSIVTVFDVTPLSHPRLHTDVVRESFATYWARLVRGGARLVAVSEATRAAMVEHGASSATVVGIGLSPPFDAALPAPNAGVKRDGVIFVGTFEPRKNAHLAVEAVQRLRARGIEATLTLVGKTGWGDQQWAERLPTFIERAGQISDSELLSLYLRSAILVCPSEVEGFGLPVLEAMAQGLLPIVSDAAALVELVGTPQLVAARDSQAIADGLATWIEDEPRRLAMTTELAVRARMHSWASIAQTWLAAYERGCG